MQQVLIETGQKNLKPTQLVKQNMYFCIKDLKYLSEKIRANIKKDDIGHQ